MRGLEIFAALSEKLGLHAPALPAAATAEQIAQTEAKIGHKLPPSLVAMYLVHDGEVIDRGRRSPRFFLDLEFLSLDEVVRNTQTYFDAGDPEADQGPPNAPIRSVPPGHVLACYFARGWVPFAGGMYAPDHLAIDYTPGPLGTVGQIIRVDADDCRRTVVAESFDAVLLHTLAAPVRRRGRR